MKPRWFVIALFAALAVIWSFAPAALAQAVAETPAAQAGHTGQHTDPWIWWKLANLVILVGVLWYLLAKPAANFFRSRTEQIQQGITDAAKARNEGEERVAEMERRMDGLGEEIERLRLRLRQEMAAEGERIRRETERHLRKIQADAEQEIDLMTKAARRDLKTYSAELALQSAEQQLKARMTNDVENTLVNSFVDDLRARAADRNGRN